MFQKLDNLAWFTVKYLWITLTVWMFKRKIRYLLRKSRDDFFSTSSSSLDPSLEVITICMREEKTEIRRDASKPHLALSFLIGIASSPATHRVNWYVLHYSTLRNCDSTQKLRGSRLWPWNFFNSRMDNRWITLILQFYSSKFEIHFQKSDSISDSLVILIIFALFKLDFHEHGVLDGERIISGVVFFLSSVELLYTIHVSNWLTKYKNGRRENVIVPARGGREWEKLVGTDPPSR